MLDVDEFSFFFSSQFLKECWVCLSLNAMMKRAKVEVGILY